MNFRPRLVSFALLLCLALAWLPAALAENTPEPKPTATPVSVDEHPGLQLYLFHEYGDGDLDLVDMKSLLYDNHYYPSNTPKDAIESNYFDGYTLKALRRCCEKNGLEFDEYGVTTDTYFAIIRGDILDAEATPSPGDLSPEEAFPRLFPMVTDGPNAHVSQLQRQLKDLGYCTRDDGSEIMLQPGLYDESMYEAIVLFCEQNGYTVPPLDPGIIESSLQAAIMESKAPRVLPTPTPEPTVDPGPGGLVGFFLKQVSVLGLTMPNWAAWLVGLALLVALGAVAMYFFMPRKDKDASAKGSTGAIQFVIEYKGKKKEYRCNIDHTLKIGRNVGDFPIDTSDRTLSGKHCEIYYSGKTLMIRDYSTNGTYVNNKNCSKGEYALHSGDTIKIGDHVITIVF